MRPSRLSGSWRILSASPPTGLQKGCTAAMTAVLATTRQRPEQGVRLSWRPDSNRVLLFTRQLRCRLRHASGGARVSRSGGRRQAAAAADLEQGEGAGDGGVEALDPPGHGDADEHVACLPDQA